jgi:hypothetical protein
MSQIENHLRDALSDVADEIPAEGVPPLNLPAGHDDTVVSLAERRGSDRRRWLAPAAAAAAVLAVAAGIAVSAGLPRPPQTGIVSQRVPRYYIATSAPDGQGDRAAIYATATGRQIAVLSYHGAPIPAFGTAAAANDRTFVIGETTANATRFYLAKFDPATREATRELSVTVLAEPTLPRPDDLQALALSPDGSRLAVLWYERGASVLAAVNLSTGSVRRWTSAGDAFGQTFGPTLSWTSDDRTLAFNWFPSPPHRGSGVRILDTARPGGNLIADSRMVLPFTNKDHEFAVSAGYVLPAQITPDGRHIVLGVTEFNNRRSAFASYSVATGQLERVFDRGSNHSDRVYVPPLVRWASPDGRTLVAFGPPGRRLITLGIVRGDQVSELPEPPHIDGATASW